MNDSPTSAAAHSQLMAQYNQWMNSRLYELCATLPDTELRKERGAFFKSIYATLNHIAYGDLAFLSRFTGNPSVVPEPGDDLFGTFDLLRVQRAALDRRILVWSEALSPAWLAESLTYTSKIDGKTRTVPKWILVAHMFNHQTHHRGQVTTLLSQMGLDIGSTDIPFMPQFQADA
ncbi:DinB family protein [Oscillatoria sp. FACHB-1406]|uniref:DinB family protein n=1 Tax=Oscillatoria sp. FACHB-1406 TaxID=2692846 RepID=UPI0016840BE5|nr:DinB family protein [Oscillatoria sp. FACHB-1406]MBD2578979.1 damage-inducible protein DinB [Oscillatoria sp. FACHB-1406]